jgi:hypothetical protein
MVHGFSVQGGVEVTGRPTVGVCSSVLEQVVAAVASRYWGEGEAEGVEGVLDAAVVDGHPLRCCCGQDG